jgi:hypothetical protein
MEKAKTWAAAYRKFLVAPGGTVLTAISLARPVAEPPPPE